LDQWLIEIKSLNILIKKKLMLSPEQQKVAKETRRTLKKLD